LQSAIAVISVGVAAIASFMAWHWRRQYQGAEREIERMVEQCVLADTKAADYAAELAVARGQILAMQSASIALYEKYKALVQHAHDGATLEQLAELLQASRPSRK
jgi:hypothetical protein